MFCSPGRGPADPWVLSWACGLCQPHLPLPLPLSTEPQAQPQTHTPILIPPVGTASPQGVSPAPPASLIWDQRPF